MKTIQTLKFLFSFDGRINRKKFFIVLILISLPNMIIGGMQYYDLFYRDGLVLMLSGESYNSFVFNFISFVISISALSFYFRRAHDLGRPGWHIFIPFYNFYVFVLLFFIKGEAQPNMYGEDPLKEIVY